MTKMHKNQPKKQKHLPLRTCIACRDTKSKRELLRIVRTPEGNVLIDATGKKSGRGAYLCAKYPCWQKALKQRKLEQEFEIEISPEDRQNLLDYIDTLPKDSEETVETAARPDSRNRPVNEGNL